MPAQGEADHKKKKRGYAAQAFDFGTGVNVAAAAAPPPVAPAQYGMPQGQPAAYGGYQQPDPQAAAAGYPGQPYGAQQQQQQQQQPAPAAAGYPAPDAYYPTPGAAPGGAPGAVGGITAGMAQMQVGAGQQPMGQAPQAVPLNQLYPTDLLNQPFNAAELDYPPPPIIIPPNVRSVLISRDKMPILFLTTTRTIYSLAQRTHP